MLKSYEKFMKSYVKKCSFQVLPHENLDDFTRSMFHFFMPNLDENPIQLKKKKCYRL